MSRRKSRSPAIQCRLANSVIGVTAQAPRLAGSGVSPGAQPHALSLRMLACVVRKVPRRRSLGGFLANPRRRSRVVNGRMGGPGFQASGRGHRAATRRLPERQADRSLPPGNGRRVCKSGTRLPCTLTKEESEAGGGDAAQLRYAVARGPVRERGRTATGIHGKVCGLRPVACGGESTRRTEESVRRSRTGREAACGEKDAARLLSATTRRATRGRGYGLWLARCGREATWRLAWEESICHKKHEKAR